MSISNFLRAQRAYLAKLTHKERSLLYSFFLFSFASPIFHIYINTFLWRQASDPVSVIVYNIGVYLGLSVGFLVNTIALRWCAAHRLYLIACVLQGIVPVVLVALVPEAKNLILLLGLIFGIAAGIYWANRNYFTSLMTRSKHRYSFLSLEQAFTTLSAIIAPITIGWFIAFGNRLQMHGSDLAYQLSATLGLLLLIFAGLAVKTVTSSNSKQRTKRLMLTGASARWNALRKMDFFNGLMHGVEMTVPLLAILMLVGKEEAVGTLQTLSSVAAALAVYVVGKRYKALKQSKVLWSWLLLNILVSCTLSIVFTPWTVALYTVVVGLVAPFRNAAIATILYETIDNEAPNERSLYLLDREVILNCGRVLSLVLLAFCFLHWPDFTLRLSLSAVLVIRLFVVMSAGTVEAMNAKTQT